MDWKIFLSTFGLIFLAELPDKTAIATLLLASRYNPLAVFLGAAGALAFQSLIAVTLGRFLAMLPAPAVHIVAGIVFLIFAVIAWREKHQTENLVETEEKKKPKTFVMIIVASFVVNFLAEWGDLTQLATATLAANTHATWTIFLAATLGLWAAVGLTALIGHGAKKFLNPRKLQKVAAAAFAIAGLVLLWKR